MELDTLGQGVVTAEKRSGGFYIGTIPSSTFTTTGNKAITGVGFKPKLVEFTLSRTGATNALMSMGAMDEHGNQFVRYSNASASGYWSNGKSNSCIMEAAPDNTWGMQASYVSMDNDGFTINVTNTGASPVYYKAYA